MSVGGGPGPSAALTVPGIVLGLGLGGFVDGIALHQIFQWHNMLSSTERCPTTTLESMETNMLADGLFHAATWMTERRSSAGCSPAGASSTSSKA